MTHPDTSSTQDAEKSRRRFLQLSLRPWGILKAAGFVLVASTLAGLAGRLSWFFDLFTQFKVQYLLGLLLIAIGLFLGKRRRSAAIFLVFAAINSASIVPLFFSEGEVATNPQEKLRLLMMNVNAQFGDPVLVQDTITRENPDIVVLEEINNRWLRQLKELAASHPHSLTDPRKDNFGIAVFSRLPLKDIKVEVIGGAQVPSIVATVETKSGALHVIATHPMPPVSGVSSEWRNEQLGKLAERVSTEVPTLLVGDLNVTPFSHHFADLLRDSGLKDSARGFGLQPSWPSNFVLFLIPLDHCLYSDHIDIIDRRIGSHVGSDHYPLIVDFAITRP